MANAEAASAVISFKRFLRILGHHSGENCIAAVCQRNTYIPISKVTALCACADVAK